MAQFCYVTRPYAYFEHKKPCDTKNYSLLKASPNSLLHSAISTLMACWPKLRKGSMVIKADMLPTLIRLNVYEPTSKGIIKKQVLRTKIIVCWEKEQSGSQRKWPLQRRASPAETKKRLWMRVGKWWRGPGQNRKSCALQGKHGSYSKLNREFKPWEASGGSGSMLFLGFLRLLGESEQWPRVNAWDTSSSSSSHWDRKARRNYRKKQRKQKTLPSLLHGYWALWHTFAKNKLHW